MSVEFFFNYPDAKPLINGEKAGRCVWDNGQELTVYAFESHLRQDDFNVSKAILSSCENAIKKVVVNTGGFPTGSILVGPSGPPYVQLITKFVAPLNEEQARMAGQAILGLVWGRFAVPYAAWAPPIKDPEKVLGSGGVSAYTVLKSIPDAAGSTGKLMVNVAANKQVGFFQSSTKSSKSWFGSFLESLNLDATGKTVSMADGSQVRTDDIAAVMDQVMSAAEGLGLGPVNDKIKAQADAIVKVANASKENSTKAISDRELALVQMETLDDREW